MQQEQLVIELRSYSEDLRCHQHAHHQLVLPVSGQLQMQIGKTYGAAGDRQLAVIAAGQDHQFSAQPDNCFVVADLPFSLAPALERLPAFIELDPALSHYAQFLYRQLQQGAGTRSTQRQMLLLLVQLLQERFGDRVTLDRRIAVARDYLDSHYHQPVTLQQLAALSHVSPRQFSALFHQQLGMPPLQYLTELRMQRAWQLLEQGQLPVQQVAEQVGYGSLSAFSHRFSERFGRSPSQVRQHGK